MILKNRKICIVGPGLKMGGIERATTNLANGLSKAEYPVTYIALFRLNSFFKLNEDIIFIEPDNFNQKRISIFKTLSWLRRIVTKDKPEIIIVYSIFYAAIVSLSLIGTNYPIFLSERSSPLYKWPWHVRLFDRLVFWIKKPKGIIAQTSIAARYQQKYYGKNIPIKVIHNSVREIQLYPELKREKFLLAVGRFNDSLKGFDRLIEAFSIMENKNWNLVFAGGDEDGLELKEQAKKKGVLNRVTFLGKVKEMDKLYARAGLFVIPSRSEGFPNALCEAMAAGVPCISFNFVAGPEDLINNGVNGVLVEEGNIMTLSREIDYLINNPDLRKEMGKKAMAIRDRLNQEKITRSILDFINENSENNDN